jgi:putative Mg2+ transporter-C (MgtC) family protein
MEWAEIYSFFDWPSIFKILLAMVLGGIVGLEREFSGRPAGLRTHILVCVGATVIVLASTAIPGIFGSDYKDTLRIDPGRLAAGIVTGIGFLGAGAIIRTRDLIRGLTTAACIWFAAALGIVIGEGFYAVAIFSTLVVVLVLRSSEFFEAKIHSPVYRTLTIRIAFPHVEAFEKKCWSLLKDRHIRLQDMDYAYNKGDDVAEIRLYVRTRHGLQSHEVIKDLKDEPGLISIRWQN